jgi:hypothetical protein
LSGAEPAIAINNINDFPSAAAIQSLARREYLRGHVRPLVSTPCLHGTGEETFDAVKMLKSADPSKYKPAPAQIIPRVASATACASSRS